VIDAKSKIVSNRIDRIRQRIRPDKSLSRSSFLIRRAAQAQFVRSRADRPSPPGRPPRTRRGKLPRAILYFVDRQREEAVIGPAYHLVGAVGGAHEHGKRFQGDRFPERKFMGPALEAVQDQIPSEFTGLIGPTI
jgi:hypothetical protein